MISEPLIRRVISYAHQLWTKEIGKQVPEFLREAPTFLREEIKAAAYGQHLYEVRFKLAKPHYTCVRIFTLYICLSHK